jgi:hypothetical protein
MSLAMKPLPEKKESLWLLIVSPSIWAAHFLLSYLTAAIWCAKFTVDGLLGPVRWTIAIYTLLGLAGIGMNGWVGYRRHRLGRATTPHDMDTPEDRHRFLGFATFLLSVLSAVAVLYAALVALFIGSCH